MAGCSDPGTDATAATSDNGVAGVLLGACYATTPTHPYYYITSPVMNGTTTSGPVTLSFQRWLNSDYTPYVNNVVEVYNGTTWVQVWQSGSSPGVHDSTWQAMSYTVTSYMNANFRVRFGQNIGSSGVISGGGWNIDDVKISWGNGCP